MGPAQLNQAGPMLLILATVNYRLSLEGLRYYSASSKMACRSDTSVSSAASRSRSGVP